MSLIVILMMKMMMTLIQDKYLNYLSVYFYIILKKNIRYYIFNLYLNIYIFTLI